MKPVQLPRALADHVAVRRFGVSTSPPRVHAASLLFLQLLAFSELRHVMSPLPETARIARIVFLAVVAVMGLIVALSYPLGAFVRLFSATRPPSLQKRQASIAFLAYLFAAWLMLCLVEGWEALDAAYFIAATLTTIGCRHLAPRTVACKLVAGTLSVAGPLSGALFWRDARARSIPQPQPALIKRVRGRETSRAGGNGALSKVTSPSKTKAIAVEQEEERQARVADVVWAFVGVFIALIACASIFLRAPRGDEGRETDTEGEPTALDAGFAALLTITTVGPATPAYGVLSRGTRALLTVVMLLGVVIFSRAIWAVVDVVAPPPFVPSSSELPHEERRSPSPHRIPSPLGQSSDVDAGKLRDSPHPPDSKGREEADAMSAASRSCPVCAANAAASVSTKASTPAAAAAATAERSRDRSVDGESKRTSGNDSIGNNQEQHFWGVESANWHDVDTRAEETQGDVKVRTPPDVVAFVERRDEEEVEEDGWVSEGEQGGAGRVGGGGEEWSDREALDANGFEAPPLEEVLEDTNEADGNDERYTGQQRYGADAGGSGNYTLDAAPHALRSWNAGGVWKGEGGRLEAGRPIGIAPDRETLLRNQVVEPQHNREVDGDEEEEEESNDGGGEISGGSAAGGSGDYYGPLESVEEGDENAEDSSGDEADPESVSQQDKRRRGVGRPRRRKPTSNQRAGGGGGVRGTETEEEIPLTADEFIVKMLLRQGKLGRMEAARMMLEFQQSVARRGGSSTSSNGRDGRAKSASATEATAGAQSGEDKNSPDKAEARHTLETQEGADRVEDGEWDEDDTAEDAGALSDSSMPPRGLAALVASSTTDGGAASAAQNAARDRGERSPPLGTPHYRKGGVGNFARSSPPREDVAPSVNQHDSQEEVDEERAVEERDASAAPETVGLASASALLPPPGL